MTKKISFTRTILKSLFVFCLCLITVLSIVPDGDDSGIVFPKLTSSGFFVHAAAYALTALLGLAAFPRLPIRILFVVIAHGLMIEGIQFFIPYRSFNPLDILANLAGITLAVVFFFQLKHSRGR